MHRFFVSAEAISNDEVVLGREIAGQLHRVLRLKPADRIIVLDNSGWEYTVELTQVEATSARGRVVARNLAQPEPRTRLTLYQALLKGQNFELVLQKGTELGVAAFVPLITARCVAQEPGGEGKRARWGKIIREAAEQSGRGRLPVLFTSMSYVEAMGQAGGLPLLPYEEEKEVTLTSILETRGGDEVSLFIGPEGGFTPEEIDLACHHQVFTVSLGPRTLRAETAALAAVAAILYQRRDLG